VRKVDGNGDAALDRRCTDDMSAGDRRPTYAWRCHACDAANNASAPTCGACGFPAVARVKAIFEARKQQGRLEAPLDSPAREAATVLAIGCIAIGGFFLRFGPWYSGMLAGAALVVVGLLILADRAA
jgi:ribosomal protein L37E